MGRFYLITVYWIAYTNYYHSDKFDEEKRLEREAYIKKEREEKNTIKFEVVTPIRKDPNRGMKFVKCNNDPINRGKLGHSKTFLKHIKKDRGYY